MWESGALGRRTDRCSGLLLLMIVAVFGCGLFPAKGIAEEERFGVIEMGSSGVRGIVLAFPGVDEAEAPPRTIFAFAPQDVKATVDDQVTRAVDHVETMRSRMIKDHIVPAKNIRIVGSSGLQLAPTAEVIRAEVERRIGGSFEYVSVEDEVRLKLRGLSTKSPRDLSMVLDIGGGNAKASYFELVDGESSAFTVEFGYGVDSLIDYCKSSWPNLPLEEALRECSKQQLEPMYAEIVRQNPALASPDRDLYLSGGICWVLATVLKPKTGAPGEEYEVLTLDPKLVLQWIDGVTTDSANAFPPLAEESMTTASLEVARRERLDVWKKFQGDKSASGAAILRALAGPLKLASRRRIYFDRNSLYAWPTAYLTAEVQEERRAARRGPGK